MGPFHKPRGRMQGDRVVRSLIFADFLFTNESAVRTIDALRDSEFTKPIYTKLGTEISHFLLRL